jgi:uncharacterized protein (DUF1778 family)
MTNFVAQAALREADAVIAEAQRMTLSERDHQKILDLIENPPPPNARLRAALAALPPLQ